MQITEDDIKKTYGGGPLRGFYSGVYSSSTNAYMLMYRQIDKSRNVPAMTVDEFPPHIQKLLKDMQRHKEKANDLIKVLVYCYHPLTNLLQEAKITSFKDSTLEEVAYDAYARFKLESLVDFSNCRLVSYNKMKDCIDVSFESNDAKFSSNINLIYSSWMLEIRKPGKIG